MKEKIKRISSSTWALILAFMMAISSFSVLAATTNVEKTGITDTTVYLVPASQSDFSNYLNSSKTDIDSRYTVKLYLHYGSYDTDPWEYVDVTKSSDTFGGNSVYISNFTDKYNGLAEMQIQIYDGETQKKLVKPITTWTEPNVYNGKVYDNGSWKTYTPDAQSVATSVSLDADNRTINVGDSLKLTASTTGKVAGNVTYTFYNGGEQVGQTQTTTASTATTTVSDLSAGDYTFTVKVTKDGYTEVASDPINVTVTGGSSSSVSDDIKSVLNGDKIMYYIGNTWGQGTEYICTEDKQQVASANNGGAVTTPTGTYYITHSVGANGWYELKITPVAGEKYLTTSTNGSNNRIDTTSSTGSATTTISDKNVVSTNFTAGNSGTGTGYTLVYYMKDSSGNYSKVGTSADEVNTKVASLSDGIYTLYTCSTDGTITVLRDTDTIDITTPVATSVALSPDSATKNTGESVTLTATANTPVSGELTYTFTETTSGATTTPMVIKSSNGTAQATFTDLSEGEHKYKVEVSANGYTSVTSSEATVTVTTKKVADSVSLSASANSIDYGSTATLTATPTNKIDGTITYTFEQIDGDSTTTVSTVNTEGSNATYVLTDLNPGTYTYRVTVSAEGYTSVQSDTVIVTVNKVPVASDVTLTGPLPGATYYVGDSVSLKASCNAPDGVTVNYYYYVNNRKINTTATPNTVKYDFQPGDVGSISFSAEAVAENYTSVKSADTNAKVDMKSVATAVSLTATPSTVKYGNDVTITATLTGDVQSGNFTYTFKETNVNGDIQSVQSNNGSATITTSDLAVGTHNISVTVSGTNFKSITSSEDLIVTVSEAYHDEAVNATSGKTMVISYDKAYAGKNNERNAIFAWGGASIADDAAESDKKMTKYSQSDIPGLYYKQLDNYVTSASTGIQFIIKQVGNWDNQSSDLGGDKFIKGKQWYFYGTKEGKQVDANAAEYTPLTFTKLNVPTEINDDNSTKFVFTVGGGLPNFFKNVVKSTTIKPEYTVTITGPDGNVVGTASSNNTEITLDTLTLTQDGEYKFTVTDGIDTVTYTKDIKVTPLVVNNYKATVNPSDNATITVTCKDTTITGGNTGELPEKRNAIISVTGIKDGYKVKNVTVKSGVTDIPVTSQGNNQYLFTMPSSDVTITVDVVAKSNYAVKFNVSDKTGGSITAKSGETTIKSGARIAEGTQVTFTAKANDGYVISGWYSDSSYTNKIDDVEVNATSYTTTISGTTNVYVKIIEDPGELQENKSLMFGSNDNPTTWNNRLPVYKKADNSYYVVFDVSTLSTSTNYYYAMTSLTSGKISSVKDVHWQQPGDTVKFTTTNSSVVSNQKKDGGYNFNNNNYDNYGMFVIKNKQNLTSLTMKITPVVDNKGATYQINPISKVAPEGAVDVYAKDGTLKTTSGYGDTTVTGMSDDCVEFVQEYTNYNYYVAMPGDRLTVTTVVNDTQAAQGWYVSNYVINGVGYDAISTVKALAAVQAGSTGASYTISTPYSVTGKETKNIIEITPIYKNRNIEAANDYITLYANADSLGDRWGNTISVYSYYYQNGVNKDDTNKKMNSAYPGEPMMKTSSGLYVAYVPKNAWDVVDGTFKKLSDYEVSGITFNNYKEGEEIHQKTLTPDQNKNFQTYDYDDFKYIAAAGYDTVLFDFQYRKAENSNQKTLVGDSTTEKDMKGSTINVDTYKDTTAHNGWDLLTNMDGEEVSILGYTAKTVPEGQTFNSTDKLHIVSVGNIDTSMGDWSTIWYVYDSAGNYVTQGLPSDFIPRYTTDADGNLKESETQSTAYNAIKTRYAYNGAYITYENEMDANTSSSGSGNSGIRSDGRWYYSRAVDQVKVNTHVLYANDTNSTSWTEDNYGSDYAGTFTGAKALVGSERTTSVDRNSEVSITASALSQGTADKQYKFIGWTSNATKGEDGTYTIVKNPSMTDSSQTVKVSTNMDLYALYIPVAKGDLIITHEKYTGENAYGGPGRYFVQATLYNKDGDTVLGTYYQEGSVTIPNYTQYSGKIDVQLIVYSVNGSRYKATYNYQNTAINDGSYVDKVCSSGDPAVVENTINARDIFDGDTMKTSKVDFYSDLQTNNITVKMNYYNRKVENGKPADMDSNPTSYSYRFTSYPKDVLNDDGTLISIQKLIEYAKNHSQQPDNMIETYVSWNSQEAAKTGITSYMNYHTNVKYVATPYHTDQYGNVQSSGEKWVTYYDRNGVEVEESKATAETVSSISIWYFNTPKKYTYTLNTANSSDQLGGNGPYYGTVPETASELFYNTRLFSSDREVSNASSPYTKAYGVEQGYTGQAINTAETIEKDGTPLKFLYWAYDKAGKKVASTNIQYGLRITNNTTLYAIYGEAELDAPGLTVQEVTPDTFFDSNNISKTRINTIFNPYNCKDNDKNIDSASVVYLRVSNATTEKSLNNLNDDQLQDLRKQISTVVSKASYEKFKSGDVDAAASQQIVQISGSTASGFKFKVVDAPSSSSTELQTSLSNKNRGQFTTTFTTSTLKNYTYYVFATMGYKDYNGTDTSVFKGSDGITYITSDNFAKYDFDKDGKYVASSNS